MVEELDDDDDEAPQPGGGGGGGAAAAEASREVLRALSAERDERVELRRQVGSVKADVSELKQMVRELMQASKQ